MHMADALISPAVGLTMYAVSGGMIAAASRQMARDPDYERKIPLMGVMGAFVFAAQMINFTIPGTGSSGHIGGGVLLSMLLGPWAAILTIASVLIVQCLLFADGGLLALGCNIFNLGFWPAFVGYPVYRYLTEVRGRADARMTVLAAVLAVALALELGAFSVTLETVLSGRTELPFGKFAAVMMGIHLPIGIIEGLITAGVYLWARQMLPARDRTAGGWTGLAPLAVAALLVGGVLAWFASTHPDGLEWSVGRITGKEELEAPAGRVTAAAQAVQEKTALLPDYGFRAAAEPPPSESAASATAPAPAAEAAEAWPAVSAGTSLAGVVGAAVTALLALLIGLGLRLFRRTGAPASG